MVQNKSILPLSATASQLYCEDFLLITLFLLYQGSLPSSGIAENETENAVSGRYFISRGGGLIPPNNQVKGGLKPRNNIVPSSL